MHQTPSISYAICVKNEGNALKKLLDLIFAYKDKHDEVVIIEDYTTDEIVKKQVIRSDVHIRRKLLNDFASHKNLFFTFCKGQYIFNLDADELPSAHLLENIKKLLIYNKNVDLFYIPRNNYIIQDFNLFFDTKKHKPKNFPDYQGRIYKNNKSMRWVKPVHEVIQGHKISKKLSAESGFFLDHFKTEFTQKVSSDLYKDIKNPIKTNKKLGVVCCYFNPCNYLSKFLNFLKFYESIIKYDLELIVVESFNKNSVYRINEKIKTETISVYSEEIYWQKEGLLNIGINELLKRQCKYISWLDADIEFQQKNWVNNLCIATEFYGASQIFSNITKHITNDKTENVNSSCVYLDNKSVESNFNKLLKRKGEPGFGFCYKSEILEELKLYDKGIVGTGDFLNIIGLCYTDELFDKLRNDRFFKNTTHDFLLDFTEWASENILLENGIGYSNNTIKSMFHGSKQKRQYINRENIIKINNFRPSCDLENTDSGLYTIKNKSLSFDIKKYFYSRDEDCGLNVTQLLEFKNISFKQHTNDLDRYYENIRVHLNDYEIKHNIDYIVVFVKTRDTKFVYEDVKLENKILIDTSNKPMINSIKYGKHQNNYMTYLQFIYNFYDILPRKCIFISDRGINLKKLTTEQVTNNILNSIKSDKDFLYIGNTTKINLTKTTNLYNRNIKSWYKMLVNKPYFSTSKLCDGDLMITKNAIRRNCKNTYLNLINKLKASDGSETNSVLDYFIEDIFDA